MALPTASDNVFPKVIISEAAAPASPSAGQFKLYVDSSDHILKYKNSSGTVVPLGTGVAAGAITGSGLTQATAKLLGRTTASSGAIEEISVGSGLTLSAGSLSASGGSAGALVFLEAHTASSSSSLDFTSFISSTYDTYQIEGSALVPGTDNTDMRLQVGTGGGPTYDTGSNYQWTRHGAIMGGTTSSVDGGNTGAGARLFNGMDATFAAAAFGAFSLTVTNLQSTSLDKIFLGTTYYLDNGTNAAVSSWGGIWLTSGTAVTALRFIMSSGTIASGTIRIYGVSKT